MANLDIDYEWIFLSTFMARYNSRSFCNWPVITVHDFMCSFAVKMYLLTLIITIRSFHSYNIGCLLNNSTKIPIT